MSAPERDWIHELQLALIELDPDEEDASLVLALDAATALNDAYSEPLGYAELHEVRDASDALDMADVLSGLDVLKSLGWVLELEGSIPSKYVRVFPDGDIAST